MSNQQLQSIRHQLEEALCARALPGREPGSGDVCEQALAEIESDLAVEVVNVRRRMANDARSALRRLETASYGICETCEQPIGTKRLLALPWASRCICCQDAEERAEQISDGSQSLWGDWPDVFFGGMQ